MEVEDEQVSSVPVVEQPTGSLHLRPHPQLSHHLPLLVDDAQPVLLGVGHEEVALPVSDNSPRIIKTVPSATLHCFEVSLVLTDGQMALVVLPLLFALL